MSGVIHWELRLAAGCLLTGMGFMMVYDVLRILRGLVPHGVFLISLEDMAYWLFCSLAVFAILYRQNDGTLRGFAIAGVFSGMIFYNHFISRHLVVGITRFLRWIGRLLFWPLRMILRPLKLLIKKLKKFVTKALKKLIKSIKIKFRKPRGNGECDEKEKTEKGRQLQ